MKEESMLADVSDAAAVRFRVFAQVDGHADEMDIRASLYGVLWSISGMDSSIIYYGVFREWFLVWSIVGYFLRSLAGHPAADDF